jgi:hypothetical protein
MYTILIIRLGFSTGGRYGVTGGLLLIKSTPGVLRVTLLTPGGTHM